MVHARWFRTMPGALALLACAACNREATPLDKGPRITQQPADQTITEGQRATFQVEYDTRDHWVQRVAWMVNGVDVATYYGQSSWTTPFATSADNGTHVQFRVYTEEGMAASRIATLTVQPATRPVIGPGPQPQVLTEGEAAHFEARAYGTAPLSLQWRQDGVPLAGRNATTLDLAALRSDDSGARISLQAVNALGECTSDPAPLTVVAATVLETLAGKLGEAGSRDGLGAEARFVYPSAACLDAAGGVVVLDDQSVLRSVARDGRVATLAYLPYKLRCLASRPGGGWFASDGYAVWNVDASGQLDLIAGAPGLSGYADGPAVQARFTGISGLAVHPSGALFVADNDNGLIRTIDPGGTVRTYAGIRDGSLPADQDGPRLQARFQNLVALAFDARGVLYVAERQVLRRISPEGVVDTLAGDARSQGTLDGQGAAASFLDVAGLAVDPQGWVLVTDGWMAGTVRRVSPAGTVRTLAGCPGAVNSRGADGVGTGGRMVQPRALCVDAEGRVYVASGSDCAVRTFLAPPHADPGRAR